MRELQEAISKSETVLEELKRIQREASESIESLWNTLKPRFHDLDSLEDLKSNKDWVGVVDGAKVRVEEVISWGEWWSSLGLGERKKVIGGVENMMAGMEVGEEPGSEVQSLVGESRVNAGTRFTHWFQSVVPECSPSLGHFRLAVAGCESISKWSVYHAWRSGDSGVHTMVWNRVGCRWEWIKRRGNFIAAGRELIGIGQDRIGHILLQHGHEGTQGVAMRLALHGGNSALAQQVLDDVGTPPFAGGEFEQSLELPLVGHQGRVFCVCTLDEDSVVTGSEDKALKVWDVRSGACQATLLGHEGAVTVVGDLGNKSIVSGSEDTTLRIWDLSSGACVQILKEHDGGILGLSVLTDGSFASCGWYGNLFTWALNESNGLWTRSRSLQGHEGDVLSLVALPGGRLASGGRDRTIQVWGKDDASKPDSVLRGHEAWIKGLACMDDGRIVSCSGDTTLRIWPANCEGEAEVILKGHKSWARCATVLGSGLIVSGDFDGYIRLWAVNGKLGKCIGEWKAYDRSVFSLSLLQDQRFVSTGSESSAFVWDADRFECSKVRGRLSDVSCGAVLGDGRIVSGGQRGEIALWARPLPGEGAIAEGVIEGPGKKVEQLARVKGGFASWHDGDDHLCLWKDGGVVGKLEGVDGWLRDLVSASDGSTLVGLDGLKGLLVWDVATRQKRHSLDMEGYCLSRVALERVVVGGQAGSVAMVNVATGHVERRAKFSVGWLYSLNHVGDGKLVGVTRDDVMWLMWAEPGKGVGLEERIGSGFGDVYGSVGESLVLVRRVDGALELWNWTSRTRHSVLGGVRGDQVAGVCWDEKRPGLAIVLLQKEGWIAYKFL